VEPVIYTIEIDRDGVIRALPFKRSEMPQGAPELERVYSLAQVEKKAIQTALRLSPSLREASEGLGINLSTLWRLRRHYGLD